MIRSVEQLNPSGKRVFVRVDFNAPIRINFALPTINFLVERGADSVRLATHIGRPDKPSPEFSTNQFKPVLKRLLGSQFDRIELLENLRFSPLEEQNDQSFAAELMAGMDYYVNEAFSVSHRAHSSIVAAAKLKPAFAGLNLLREVAELEKLGSSAKRPFVVLVGGAKVQDKLELIERMSKIADRVLVGGRTGIEYRKTEDGRQRTEKIMPLLDDVDGLDIGPKTIELFKQELAKAKTIFWNGNLGKSEEPAYAKGDNEIARFLAKLTSYRVIGGGDTLAAVSSLGLADRFDFVSTGGGATLEFLAGKQLPGLKALGYYS